MLWRRVICSCVVLVACGKTQPEKARPAPVAEPVPVVAATPIDAVDAMVADARPLAEGEYATRADRYIGAYLDLLWIDLSLHEMLRRYPGVPKTNRYSSYSVTWEQPNRKWIGVVLRNARLAAERVVGENDETDRAVHAYASTATQLWPALDKLGEYYAEQRYVDDEFERGRREQQLVPEAIAKLAPLRTPMIESVFAGWREAAGDKPESPRAVLGASFEACMRLAMQLFRDRNVDGPRDPKVEATIDKQLSACRRGVGSVSALPAAFQSFDEPLRTAAIRLGNAVESNFGRDMAIDEVRTLVKAFIERWPKLPSEPAERPVERVE